MLAKQVSSGPVFQAVFFRPSFLDEASPNKLFHSDRQDLASSSSSSSPEPKIIIIIIITTIIYHGSDVYIYIYLSYHIIISIILTSQCAVHWSIPRAMLLCSSMLLKCRSQDTWNKHPWMSSYYLRGQDKLHQRSGTPHPNISSLYDTYTHMTYMLLYMMVIVLNMIELLQIVSANSTQTHTYTRLRIK